MQLRMLREHYARKKNNVWIPKLSFTSEEDIKALTGYDPEMCNYYTCSVCSKLHIATHVVKNRNKVK